MRTIIGILILRPLKGGGLFIMVYIRGVQPDSLGRYCVLTWTGRVLTHVESLEEGFVRQVDGLRFASLVFDTLQVWTGSDVISLSNSGCCCC